MSLLASDPPPELARQLFDLLDRSLQATGMAMQKVMPR